MSDDELPPHLAPTAALPTEHQKPGRLVRSRPALRKSGETLQDGLMVGSYIIEELAFEGGFASIYRAYHADTNRPAAIKVLHQTLADSARMIERFEREAIALNRLHHPNIVEIYELGELTEFRPYIAMEWLDGRNLHEELRMRGPFTDREALAVMRELGAALQAAHDLGIVHRDLKTHNVIALPRDSWFTLKLVDFGIAKLTAPADQGTAMTTKTVIGTPHTMAPEQIMCKEVDARTDVYALGVMLYQLVTGRLPFQGSNLVEVEEMHLHAAPPRPSEIAPVPAALDSVVQRALKKDKEDRYASVAQMLVDLEDAVHTGVTLDLRVKWDTGRATCPGIALYVQVQAAGGANPDDDDVLDALDDALDSAREQLAQASLSVVLETPKELLGATTLPGGNEAGYHRDYVVSRALEMYGRLLAESGAAGVIDVAIAVHVADVEAELPAGEMVGGPLLALGEWPRGWPPSGVFATKQTLFGAPAQFRHSAIEGSDVIYRVVAPGPSE